ncbi:papain-like cysteine peptidase [Bacillus paralicheniformis]|uniref:DUF1796 family putative cysteine peptidase n=1 Tax=Bacillus paralicheniformis TaxID=1648923 RepID=UPI00208EA9DA|nr:DUF1796 family putative cysteine peptidase [Bacillus paralicheniformis]MDE1383479.1 DUF1796 family putative cysteine peptidase [Bacillus paralicheniformis]USO20099.1 papain-like cysteine peptidase [Bacillus paralicheniformis]
MLTALQLRENNLRPYAGPLDWVGTSSLTELNRLLKNRFSNFMAPLNLRVTGCSTGVYTTDRYISVTDDYYHAIQLMILKQIKIHSNILPHTMK